MIQTLNKNLISEYVYQQVLINFGNMEYFEVEGSMVEEILIAYFDDDETINSKKMSQDLIEVLESKSEMLEKYFQIEI